MTRSERPAADEDDVADLVNQQAVDLDSSGAKKSGEVDRLSLRKSSRREENAEKQQDSSAEHRLTPIYAATVFVFKKAICSKRDRPFGSELAEVVA